MVPDLHDPPRCSSCLRELPAAHAPAPGPAGEATILCAECALGIVPSPCIQVCEVDAKTQTCRGCKRTLKEIEAWPLLSNAKKREVLRRIAGLPGL